MKREEYHATNLKKMKRMRAFGTLYIIFDFNSMTYGRGDGRTERQTERQIDRQRDIQTYRQMDVWTDTPSYGNVRTPFLFSKKHNFF